MTSYWPRARNIVAAKISRCFVVDELLGVVGGLDAAVGLREGRNFAAGWPQQKRAETPGEQQQPRVGGVKKQERGDDVICAEGSDVIFAQGGGDSFAQGEVPRRAEAET